MENVVEAILLGLIQGLTEFFPVSSSGHLVLAADIFGINAGDNLTFDLLLHCGTLLAVIAVFYKDILNLFKPPFKNLWMLVVATVPAAVIGFFLEDKLKDIFGKGNIIPFFFLLTAAILLTTEFLIKKGIAAKKERRLGYGGAAVMGLVQAAAVLPGLSRSGSTISAGLLYGEKRENVARFSFLMSVAIIAGSATASLLSSFMDKESGGTGMSFGIIAMAAGVLAAAFSGFVALKLMLKMISKNNYKWFAAYLIAVSAVAIVNYYIVTIW